MNKGTATVGFILSFLAGGLFMYGVKVKGGGGGHGATATNESVNHGTWADAASPVPVSAQDPMWGNRNAPVTMVIFSDFQCPFCKRVEGTINQLKQQYGKDKLRVIWKNQPLPFHKNAKPAAMAAQAVFQAGGSEAFWKFHRLAFENNRALSPEKYKEWAVQAGVPAAKFEAELKKPQTAAKVAEDQALAQKVGARGTPHFFINGERLSGAQPLPKFKKAIDGQLAKAKAAGVPADKVYVKLSKQNFAKPKPPKKPPGQDDKTVWKVPVGKSPFRGPADAQVTVVIYSDYQCPFCKRVEPTLKKVMDTYKGKVRIVWKDQPLPFHPRAMPAAYVAREALAQKGVKGFWEAHDKLFESQPKLGDEDLDKVVKALGLDEKKYKASVEKKAYDAAIKADMATGMDVNVRGTPHLFVNGRRLVGAQPFAKFKEIIDQEIKKTDAMKAKGIAANKIYEEIMKTGKEPPPPEVRPQPDLTGKEPYRGKKGAKVVIHEWSDFQCPFCSRVEPTINKIMEKYGDKVQFVWHHYPLPFHKKAPLASMASIEVFNQKGNDAFWKYHHTLFKNQRSKDGLDRPKLEEYAKEAGVDMDKFKKALDSKAHQGVLDKEKEIAKKVRVTGTPAFTINGYWLSGAQGYPKFERLIERALKDVKEGRKPGEAAKKKK